MCRNSRGFRASSNSSLVGLADIVLSDQKRAKSSILGLSSFLLESKKQHPRAEFSAPTLPPDRPADDTILQYADLFLCRQDVFLWL
jgi:hypothetical protein